MEPSGISDEEMATDRWENEGGEIPFKRAAIKFCIIQNWEKFMKKAAGLWIDHKRAVVVLLSGDAEEIKRIESDVRKSGNHSDSSVRADDLLQNEFTEHLNKYYDEVIVLLGKAETILIMGPGEAKGELKKRLEKSPLKGSEVEVETVDKLTENQIVSKVREYFVKSS